MKIALFADGVMGTPTFHALRKLGHETVLVWVTGADDHENVWYEPVEQTAEDWNVSVVKLGKDEVLLTYLEMPELIISAGFREIIPEYFLKKARLGAYNLHPSLLPKYRGRCPVNWCLINGEEATGLTLHKMVEKVDAGPIVDQEYVRIGEHDIAVQVWQRINAHIEPMLSRWLPQIETGDVPVTPQDESQSTYFGRRKPEDGEFQWDWSARRIHNMVRALTHPYPGACVMEGGKRLELWRTKVVEDPADYHKAYETIKPGYIAYDSKDRRMLAGTGDGVLEILDWSREI